MGLPAFDVKKILHKTSAEIAVCGFDIGTSSVKAVVLQHTKEKPVLKAFTRKDIFGVAKEELTNVVLPSVLSAVGYHAKMPLNVCVGGSGVITRVITMPKMGRAEMGQALQYEADKYLPFDVKDVIMDFSVLGEEQDKAQVLLVAAKKALVEDKVELLEKLNCRIRIVDTEATALANLFLYYAAYVPEAQGSKGVALIDLGGKVSNLVVLKDLKFVFSRDIGTGGFDFIKVLQQAGGLTEQQATEQFVQKKFQMEGSEPLQAALQNFINQIKISFDYCENQYGISVDKVYVSGGLSKSDGIIEFMKQKLGYEFSRLSLKDIMVLPEGTADESEFLDFNIALGLALRVK